MSGSDRKIFEALKALDLPLSPPGEDPYHAVLHRFIASSRDRENVKLLELGSRAVSGLSRREWFAHIADYVGFDILDGPNVDMRGDIHRLSQYFTPNSVDLMFSISVFEHLMMPWKAVLEINKVLKVGGEIYVSTHPTWSPHELPWDFYRFLSGSAKTLFNKHTGFEIIEVVEGLPCRIVSLIDDPPTHDLKYQPANLGIAIRAKKVCEHSPALKWDLYPEDIDGTMYPDQT